MLTSLSTVIGRKLHVCLRSHLCMCLIDPFCFGVAGHSTMGTVVINSFRLSVIQIQGNSVQLCVLSSQGASSSSKQESLILFTEIYHKIAEPLGIKRLTLRRSCLELSVRRRLASRSVDLPTHVLGQLKQHGAVPTSCGGSNLHAISVPLFREVLIAHKLCNKEDATTAASKLSNSSSTLNEMAPPLTFTIKKRKAASQTPQGQASPAAPTTTPQEKQHHQGAVAPPAQAAKSPQMAAAAAAATQQDALFAAYTQQQKNAAAEVLAAAGVTATQPATQAPTPSPEPATAQQGPSLHQPGKSAALRHAAQRINFPRGKPYQYWPLGLDSLTTRQTEALGTRYGIGSLISTSREASGLRQQLRDLEQHLTSPFNGFRQGKHLQPVTFSQYRDVLDVFFGVVHHHFKVGLSELSLWDVVSPHYLATYLYLQLYHKQVVKDSLHQQSSRIIRVLDYLEQQTCNEEQASVVRKAAKWFANLKSQCVPAALSSEPVDITRMPPLGELLTRQAAYIEKKMDMFERWQQHAGEFSTSKMDEAIWGLQSAALMAMLFGYLPPMRLLATATLKHPDYADTPCTECHKVGCKGNRVYYNKDDNGRLWVDMPHHKVANTAVAPSDVRDPKRPRVSTNHIAAAPVTCPLPEELSKVVGLWAKQGRAAALDQGMVRVQGAEARKLLFWHPTTQGAFTDKQISPWFKDVLTAMGVPEDKLFCPRQARHLWVTTVRVMQQGGQSVPHMRGMAHIMGHSPEQWYQDTYNRSQKQLEIQMAVEGLPQLRQQLLQEGATRQQQKAPRVEPQQSGQPSTQQHVRPPQTQPTVPRATQPTQQPMPTTRPQLQQPPRPIPQQGQPTREVQHVAQRLPAPQLQTHTIFRPFPLPRQPQPPLIPTMRPVLPPKAPPVQPAQMASTQQPRQTQNALPTVDCRGPSVAQPYYAALTIAEERRKRHNIYVDLTRESD